MSQTAIFLAARSNSKRLKNKHFLKINNKINVIEACIKRLKKSKKVKKIFLCTTKNKEDKKFYPICKKLNIKIFFGNEKNVLKRFITCAKNNNIKTIIRITADCPLIDSKIIDDILKIHNKKKNDYTSNVLELTYPDGLDVEIIELQTLMKSNELDKSNYNKEHVTPFVRRSDIFKKSNLRCYKNFSNRRWTLDTINDYIFIKKIYKYFYPKIFFSWKEVIKAEKKNKDLICIKKRRLILK